MYIIIIIRHGHFFIVSGVPIQTSDGKDFSFEQSNQEIEKTFWQIHCSIIEQFFGNF